MSEDQILDIAMYNSYNVIIHKKPIEDIEISGVPVFVHVPTKEVDELVLKTMCMYFEIEEEYEICKEISDEYQRRFKKSMPPLQCNCKNPEYEVSTSGGVRCTICRTQLL